MIGENPALRRVLKKAKNGNLTTEGQVEGGTVKGSLIKAVFFCLIVVAAAVASVLVLENLIQTQNEAGLMIFIVAIVISAIPMLIISIVIAIFPKTAAVLGVVYCLLNGVLLGAVTAIIDMAYPGISFVALLGTCVVFLIAVVIFRLMGSRTTINFTRGVMIAFFSLIAVELLCLLLSFIPAFSALFSNIWLQLLISAVTIVIATLVIVINLNTIYRIEEYRVDKKYEWLAAFSLTVTLIWVYMEILELLVKIASLTGRRN